MDMATRLKQAADASEKAFKENYPKPGEQPLAGNTATATPATASTPASGSQPSTETPATATETPASTATPPVTPETPAPEGDYKKLFEEMKHKHDVLKGKYDKEISEANANSAKALNDLAEMRIQLSAYVNQARADVGKPTGEKPTAPNNTPPTFSLKPEQTAKIPGFEKEYPDMIASGLREFITAVVYEALNGSLAGYLPKLDRIDNIEREVVRSRVSAYDARLTELCSDWSALNDSAEFAGWLQGTFEKMSGLTMWDLIRAAHSRGDAEAVATIMNTYKAAKGIAPAVGTPPGNGNGNGSAVTPAPVAPAASTAATTPAPSTANANANLNLAPPRPAGGKPGVEGHVAPGASGEPATFTRDQVRAFYNDVVKGVFRGRDAEKAKIEADINTASREGRITP